MSARYLSQCGYAFGSVVDDNTASFSRLGAFLHPDLFIPVLALVSSASVSSRVDFDLALTGSLCFPFRFSVVPSATYTCSSVRSVLVRVLLDYIENFTFQIGRGDIGGEPLDGDRNVFRLLERRA